MSDIQNQILMGITSKKPAKQLDLGTLVGEKNNSNLNLNWNVKGNWNVNRLQPCRSDNHVEASPQLVPPTPAVAVVDKGLESPALQPGKAILADGPKFGYIPISTQDLYTEINVQINNVRLEGKYKRLNVYISLKRDCDTRYSVFLTGAATNCKTELNRGAKKKREVVLDIITTLFDDHPNALVARLHYKAPKGIKTSDFHRKLLNHAMIAVYEQDGEWHAQLYLLGEYDYDISLNTELTKKQRELYTAAGIWRRDWEEFTDEEELG